MKKICLSVLLIMSLFIINNAKIKAYDSYEIGDVLGKGKFIVIENSDSDSQSVTVVQGNPYSKNEIVATGVLEPLVEGSEQWSINNLLDENGNVVYYWTTTNCNTARDHECTNAYNNSVARQIINKYVEKNDVLSNAAIATAFNEGENKGRLLNSEDIQRIQDALSDATDTTALIAFWESLIPKNIQSVSFWLDNEGYSESLGTNKTICATINSSDTDETSILPQVGPCSVYNLSYILPVYTLNKEYICNGDVNASKYAGNCVADDSDPSDTDMDDNSNKDDVSVDNTLLKQSIITLVVGGIIIVIGVVIYIYNKKRK